MFEITTDPKVRAAIARAHARRAETVARLIGGRR